MKLVPLLFLVSACWFCLNSMHSLFGNSILISPWEITSPHSPSPCCWARLTIIPSTRQWVQKGTWPSEIQCWDFCHFCRDFYLNNISLGVLAIMSTKSSPENRAITGENRTKKKRNTKSYWYSFRPDPAMPEGRSIPGLFTLLVNELSFCLTQVWIGLYLPEKKVLTLEGLLSQEYLEEAI